MVIGAIHTLAVHPEATLSEIRNQAQFAVACYIVYGTMKKMHCLTHEAYRSRMPWQS